MIDSIVKLPPTLPLGRVGVKRNIRRHPKGWARVAGTAHATPGTEVAVAHGLDYIPTIAILQASNTAFYVDVGLYLSNDTAATGFNATNIYVKSTAVSAPFVAWVI
jgi:hypothetical protein